MDLRVVLYIFYSLTIVNAQSKLCRVYDSRNFFTVTVGDDWQPYTCAALQQDMNSGSNGYVLGCTFANGTFSMGSQGGGDPSSNCNWDSETILSHGKTLSTLTDAPTKWCLGWVARGMNGIITGIGVGDAWTFQNCASLMMTGPPFLAVDDFRVGCVFNDSFSISSSSTTLPYPNCGWESPTTEDSRHTHLSLQHSSTPEDLDLPGYKTCFINAYFIMDFFIVPKSWTAKDCYQYGAQMDQSSQFFVGCTFPDGTFSFGGEGGGLPSPNCGWFS